MKKLTYVLILICILCSICYTQENPWVTVDDKNVTGKAYVFFSPGWKIVSVQRHSTGWVDTALVKGSGGIWVISGQITNIQRHESHCYTVTFQTTWKLVTQYYTTTLWIERENIVWKCRRD